MTEPDKSPTSRRAFVVGGAAMAAAAAAAAAKAAKGAKAANAGRPGNRGGVTDSQARLLDKVTAATTSNASLSDVKHIVILMQENRSFDHYFGTLSGIRGFSDPGVLANPKGGTVFDQYGYQPGTGVDANGYTQPFNLKNNPPTENGYDTNDIDHSWGGQHASWNHGAMDSFMTSHLSTDGDANGPVTMGYYTRAELPFYHALADAFTICDGYHCSVLGPTDPNRLYSYSASIDPAGTHGGPVLTTATDRAAMTGTLSWKTMPEALLEAGVSWKVYNDPTGLLGLGVLSYFKNYTSPSVTGLELAARALTPTYPGNFASDVENGTLPSVSWIVPPLYECEHPAAPPEWGEYLVQHILNTLAANPDVWAQTVFIVNYDENGGFFDHVPPATPPKGTAGEYLTVSPLPSSASGIAGPIGLGFRVPALVISPFSAGGYKYSGPLDHTSTLRLIETRFGVEVPNLTPWRRKATGDLTGALNLTAPPVTKIPALPPTTLIGNTTVVEEAVLNALTGTEDVGIDYPLPTSNSMPKQETTPPRPTVP
ncbi:MAG: phospholipase [Nocardiopsaceae bacterium]|nr:phospholipase [Nocardiopsaceae bacterium]